MAHWLLFPGGATDTGDACGVPGLQEQGRGLEDPGGPSSPRLHPELTLRGCVFQILGEQQKGCL